MKISKKMNLELINRFPELKEKYIEETNLFVKKIRLIK